MKTIRTEKTNYNGRTRKAQEIVAVIAAADGVHLIDAISPGKGNHRAALEWAEWRAKSIETDYKDAAKMTVFCGNVGIAVIYFEETENVTDFQN